MRLDSILPKRSARANAQKENEAAWVIIVSLCYTYGPDCKGSQTPSLAFTIWGIASC